MVTAMLKALGESLLLSSSVWGEQPSWWAKNAELQDVWGPFFPTPQHLAAASDFSMMLKISELVCFLRGHLWSVLHYLGVGAWVAFWIKCEFWIKLTQKTWAKHKSGPCPPYCVWSGWWVFRLYMRCCSSETQEWAKPDNRYYIVSPTVVSQYLIKCNCMNLSW